MSAAERATRGDFRSTTEQGYGSAHQKERVRVARRVARGTETCARCGRPIVPGTPWDLDHTDDRSGYLGPSHRRCNRRAGRLKQARAQRARLVRLTGW